MMSEWFAVPWWTWVGAFFGAAFAANGIPHYVHGLSGKRFPTPFSGGAGTLDGPVRNVFWGAGNLIAGGVLLWLIRNQFANPLVLAELLLVAVGGGALLGKALSRPARPGHGPKSETRS
jgi:hypothetical protein